MSEKSRRADMQSIRRFKQMREEFAKDFSEPVQQNPGVYKLSDKDPKPLPHILHIVFYDWEKHPPQPRTSSRPHHLPKAPPLQELVEGPTDKNVALVLTYPEEIIGNRGTTTEQPD